MRAPPRPQPGQRRGYTLLEVLMVVALIAMLAALAIPLGSDEARLRKRAAAAILVSDIELAQMMNISNPKQPVIVRFDPDNATYWLAYETSPNDPMPRASAAGGGEPHSVTFGQGRASSAADVSVSVASMPSNTLRFNPHGGLKDFSAAPTITLSHEHDTRGRNIVITITPATGTIREQ